MCREIPDYGIRLEFFKPIYLTNQNAMSEVSSTAEFKISYDTHHIALTITALTR